jgi:hypothetical protein
MLCSEPLTPLHKKFSRAQTYYSTTDISIFSFTSTASAACLHRCKLRHGLGLLCRTPINNIVYPHSSSVVVETRHEWGGQEDTIWISIGVDNPTISLQEIGHLNAVASILHLILHTQYRSNPCTVT